LLSPSAKVQGKFLDSHGLVGGCENIQQDLEAHPRQVRRGGAQAFGAQHEIAAHRVGKLDTRHLAGDGVGQVGDAHAVGPAPLVGAGAFGKARGDGNVAFAAGHGLEHAGQQCRVVLVIGVHHRDDGRRGRHHALDRSGSEPAPADAMEYANTPVIAGDLARFVRGAVRAVVVDEDRFPRNPRQRLVEPLDQRGEIAPLVEGGQHDRQFERPGDHVRQLGEIRIRHVHAPVR